jgi:serine/threonine-protein kinase HipA
MSTVASVHLWGRPVGAVVLEDDSDTAVFQYDPDFARSGIQVSPVTMPLRPDPYAFPALPQETFRGLPGMLADSLPDRYGTALIDTWLSSEGRTPTCFNAVERLCYIGARGMGALEYLPARGQGRSAPRSTSTAWRPGSIRCRSTASGMTSSWRTSGNAPRAPR